VTNTLGHVSFALVPEVIHELAVFSVQLVFRLTFNLQGLDLPIGDFQNYLVDRFLESALSCIRVVCEHDGHRVSLLIGLVRGIRLHND